MSKRVEMLLDTVKVLAADPTVQLKYLNDLGLPELIDELALEFDDIAAVDDMLFLQEIDKNQYDAVKELDDLLSRMSGAANARLWTTEALISAPEDVRNAAGKCLRMFQGNS